MLDTLNSLATLLLPPHYSHHATQQTIPITIAAFTQQPNRPTPFRKLTLSRSLQLASPRLASPERILLHLIRASRLHSSTQTIAPLEFSNNFAPSNPSLETVPRFCFVVNVLARRAPRFHSNYTIRAHYNPVIAILFTLYES